jgi:hypothetical protein
MNQNCKLLANFGKSFQYKVHESYFSCRELFNTYRELDMAMLNVFVAANCIAK